MVDLDKRQLGILKQMGVDVWQLREQDSDSVEVNPIGELSEDAAAAVGEGSKSADYSGEAASGSLVDIATTISSCERCQLHKTRINTVPGVGNPLADWLFVGEAPGQNEDQQGLPFVGRAGQLLDAMIKALNMERADVFIANVIKCRPPGNRDPLPDEVDQCEPFLHQQLNLIQPKVIIALGRISAQALLKSPEALGKMRGRVYQYGSSGIPLIVTYHPAYLLRSPEHKARAWEDLLMAKSIVTPVIPGH